MSKSDEIKAERDRRFGAGVLVNGTWWQTDAHSRTQMLQMLAADIPSTEWKACDGELVNIDAGIARTVIRAALQNDMAIHAAAERHLLALQHYPADPNNYDFSSGWPTAFGE